MSIRIRIVVTDKLDMHNVQLSHASWSNVVSRSKFFEDQHDVDLLDEADRTLHLGFSFPCGATCSVCLVDSGMCQEIDDRCEQVFEDVLLATEHDVQRNCEVIIEPMLCELRDGKDVNLIGISSPIFRGIANITEMLHVDDRDVSVRLQPSWCESEENIQTLFHAEKSDCSKAFTALNNIPSSPCRKVCSSYRFTTVEYDTYNSRNYDSREKTRIVEECIELPLLVANEFYPENVSMEWELHSQAVIVFLDLFPDALSSPESPLMELHADSLIINELAGALRKSCNKSIKVVDLFSHNTLTQLLCFLSQLHVNGQVA